MTSHVRVLPFGATMGDDGTTQFRIWAPSVPVMEIVLNGGSPVALQPQASGWHCGRVACDAGTRYCYRLPNGTLVPDPASRLQDDDVHGASVVVDPSTYDWQATDWRGRPWHETVIYELHAGLLGGFAGIEAELEQLRELGVTAIELMPIADFPGRRNWGYDGVLPFAPDSSYGTPAELKTMIDRAHCLGLMVFLDVVYNHFGPDGNYLHAYAADFFEAGTQTPWGAAIAFARPEVRSFFVENALYWLQEYRFDGLRFDATHAIVPQEFLLELACAVRAEVEPGRHVHLVLEHEGNRASLLGPGRFDAQWADDAHHCLHVLLTGEQEGYYADYDSPADQLARCLSEGFAYQGETSPRGHARGEASGHLPSSCFVFCLQNHDQIGNRAFGDRLTALADPNALLAAQALLLLAPQIPLLFMGEQFATRAPFLFFTDHHDELADLVRDGRRREFAHFAAFADPRRRESIPDPNAPETYARSIPDRADSDAHTETQMRKLLTLRQQVLMPRLLGCHSMGAQSLEGTGVMARWRLNDGSVLVLACNLGRRPVGLNRIDESVLFATREEDLLAVHAGELPAHSTVAFLAAPA